MKIRKRLTLIVFCLMMMMPLASCLANCESDKDENIPPIPIISYPISQQTYQESWDILFDGSSSVDPDNDEIKIPLVFGQTRLSGNGYDLQKIPQTGQPYNHTSCL